MEQFNSKIYKEKFVLYKQNPEPCLPETLFYMESRISTGTDIIWMGTSIDDATIFNELDDIIVAYLNVVNNTNEEIGVMMISTILSTIPTVSFADTLHNTKVDAILNKLDTEDISYLKETGILK